MLKKPKLFLSFISTVLITVMLCQDLAWAFPAQPAVVGPHVFYIQDPHSNPSGQENLAKLIQTLAKTDFKNASPDKPILIFSEGGSGDCTLDFVKVGASPKALQRTAKRFLSEGRLQGEEYLNLTTDMPIKIIGMEDEALYRENLAVYKKILTERAAVLAALAKASAALQKLKNKNYPESLLIHEAEPSSNFLARTKSLMELARDHRVSGLYPNLEKILRLPQTQAELADFNAPETLREFDALEGAVYATLLEPEAWKIHELDREITLYQKALNIQLTSEEFDWLVNRRKNSFFEFSLGVINRRLAESGYFEDILNDRGVVDQAWLSVERFYGLTRERDAAFLKTLKQQAFHKAIMIAGGFHAKHLTQLLRENAYSCETLTPEVQRETIALRYEKNLLAAKTLRAALLAHDGARLAELQSDAGDPKKKMRLGMLKGILGSQPDKNKAAEPEAAAPEAEKTDLPEKTLKIQKLEECMELVLTIFRAIYSTQPTEAANPHRIQQLSERITLIDQLLEILQGDDVSVGEISEADKPSAPILTGLSATLSILKELGYDKQPFWSAEESLGEFLLPLRALIVNFVVFAVGQSTDFFKEPFHYSQFSMFMLPEEEYLSDDQALLLARVGRNLGLWELDILEDGVHVGYPAMDLLLALQMAWKFASLLETHLEEKRKGEQSGEGARLAKSDATPEEPEWAKILAKRYEKSLVFSMNDISGKAEMRRRLKWVTHELKLNNERLSERFGPPIFTDQQLEIISKSFSEQLTARLIILRPHVGFNLPYRLGRDLGSGATIGPVSWMELTGGLVGDGLEDKAKQAVISEVYFDWRNKYCIRSDASGTRDALKDHAKNFSQIKINTPQDDLPGRPSRLHTQRVELVDYCLHLLPPILVSGDSVKVALRGGIDLMAGRRMSGNLKSYRYFDYDENTGTLRIHAADLMRREFIDAFYEAFGYAISSQYTDSEEFKAIYQDRPADLKFRATIFEPGPHMITVGPLQPAEFFGQAFRYYIQHGEGMEQGFSSLEKENKHKKYWQRLYKYFHQAVLGHYIFVVSEGRPKRELQSNGQAGARLAAFELAEDRLDRNFISRLTEDDRSALNLILSQDLSRVSQAKKFEKQTEGRIFISLESLQNKNEGRTVYLKLQKPVDGIGLLKFKGVRPRIVKGQTLDYRGSGFVSRILSITAHGAFTTVPGEPYAMGALTPEGAETEHQRMAAADGFKTDRPLGWGVLVTKRAPDERFGFVVSGLEGAEDNRMAFVPDTSGKGPDLLVHDTGRLYRVDLAAGRKEEILLTDSALLYAALGRYLRAYHDQGFIHRYLHPGNLGLIRKQGQAPAYELVLRDLDTSTPIEGNASERARLRMIDFETVIFHIHQLQRDPWISRSLAEAFADAYFFDRPRQIRDAASKEMIGRDVWMVLSDVMQEGEEFELSAQRSVAFRGRQINNPFRSLFLALRHAEKPRQSLAGARLAETIFSAAERTQALRILSLLDEVMARVATKNTFFRNSAGRLDESKEMALETLRNYPPVKGLKFLEILQMYLNDQIPEYLFPDLDARLCQEISNLSGRFHLWTREGFLELSVILKKEIERVRAATKREPVVLEVGAGYGDMTIGLQKLFPKTRFIATDGFEVLGIPRKNGDIYDAKTLQGRNIRTMNVTELLNGSFRKKLGIAKNDPVILIATHLPMNSEMDKTIFAQSEAGTMLIIDATLDDGERVTGNPFVEPNLDAWMVREKTLRASRSGLAVGTEPLRLSLRILTRTDTSAQGWVEHDGSKDLQEGVLETPGRDWLSVLTEKISSQHTLGQILDSMKKPKKYLYPVRKPVKKTYWRDLDAKSEVDPDEFIDLLSENVASGFPTADYLTELLEKTPLSVEQAQEISEILDRAAETQVHSTERVRTRMLKIKINGYLKRRFPSLGFSGDSPIRPLFGKAFGANEAAGARLARKKQDRASGISLKPLKKYFTYESLPSVAEDPKLGKVVRLADLQNIPNRNRAEKMLIAKLAALYRLSFKQDEEGKRQSEADIIDLDNIDYFILVGPKFDLRAAIGGQAQYGHSEASFCHLMVHANQRRKGAGAFLVKSVLSVYHREGVRVIRSPIAVAALDFYQRITSGFPVSFLPVNEELCEIYFELSNLSPIWFVLRTFTHWALSFVGYDAVASLSRHHARIAFYAWLMENREAWRRSRSGEIYLVDSIPVPLFIKHQHGSIRGARLAAWLPARSAKAEWKRWSSYGHEFEKIKGDRYKLLLDKELAAALDPNDRKLLLTLLSGNLAVQHKLMLAHREKIYLSSLEKKNIHDKAESDGRTIYLTLEKEIEWRGKKIKTLRLKGIRPRFNRQGKVRPYKKGRGVVDRLEKVDGTGRVVVKRLIRSPFGTMDSKEVVKEFGVMRDWTYLNSEHFVVHAPLGIGLYDFNSFDDDRVGFVVAGMPAEDARFNFVKPLQRGAPPVLMPINLQRYITRASRSTRNELVAVYQGLQRGYARNIGRAFRAYHDKGYFHRFPNPSNIGTVIGENGKIVMVDLGTTVNWNSFSTNPSVWSAQVALYTLWDLEKLLTRVGFHQTPFRVTLDIAGEILSGYFYDSNQTKEFRAMARNAVGSSTVDIMFIFNYLVLDLLRREVISRIPFMATHDLLDHERREEGARLAAAGPARTLAVIRKRIEERTEYRDIRSQLLSEHILLGYFSEFIKNGQTLPPYLVLDGMSAAGKSRLIPRAEELLQDTGYSVAYLNLDGWFRDRTERYRVIDEAVEKNSPNLDEETLFYDWERLKADLQNISDFFISGQKEAEITFPTFWNADTKKYESKTIKLTKNTIVILEGKYANSPRLQGVLGDRPYRVRLNVTRELSRKRFYNREKTRRSPSELEKIMKAYDLIFLPSYEHYLKTTVEGLHGINFYDYANGDSDDDAPLAARLAAFNGLVAKAWSEATPEEILDIIKKALKGKKVDIRKIDKNIKQIYIVQLAAPLVVSGRKGEAVWIHQLQIGLSVEAGPSEAIFMDPDKGILYFDYAVAHFKDPKFLPAKLLPHLNGAQLEATYLQMKKVNGLVRDWKVWTEAEEAYQVYRKEVDPILADIVLHAIQTIQPASGKPYVIADIFGGDGRFLRALKSSLQRNSVDARLTLVDRERSLVTRALQLDRDIAVRIQDLTQDFDLKKVIGEAPHIVVAEGGLAEIVISRKDALKAAEKVFAALEPGGFFILMSYTSSQLFSDDFKKIGFEVLNKTVAYKDPAEKYPSQLYILKKPAGARLAGDLQLSRAERLRRGFSMDEVSRFIGTLSGRDDVYLSNASTDSYYRTWAVQTLGRKFGKPLKILSLASGQGQLEDQLGAEGHQVTAVEFHPEFVEALKGRPNIEHVIQADAQNPDSIPLEPGSFDLILISEAIGVMGLDVIAGSKKFLKPSGKIVVLEYVYDQFTEDYMIRAGAPIFRVRESEMREAFEKAGYDYLPARQYKNRMVFYSGELPSAARLAEGEGVKLRSTVEKWVRQLGESQKPLTVDDVYTLNGKIFMWRWKKDAPHFNDKHTPGVRPKLELFLKWVNAAKGERAAVFESAEFGKTFKDLQELLMKLKEKIDLDDPVVHAALVNRFNVVEVGFFHEGKHRTGWGLMNVLLRRQGLKPLYYKPVDLAIFNADSLKDQVEQDAYYKAVHDRDPLVFVKFIQELSKAKNRVLGTPWVIKPSNPIKDYEALGRALGELHRNNTLVGNLTASQEEAGGFKRVTLRALKIFRSNKGVMSFSLDEKRPNADRDALTQEFLDLKSAVRHALSPSANTRKDDFATTTALSEGYMETRGVSSIRMLMYAAGFKRDGFPVKNVSSNVQKNEDGTVDFKANFEMSKGYIDNDSINFYVYWGPVGDEKSWRYSVLAREDMFHEGDKHHASAVLRPRESFRGVAGPFKAVFVIVPGDVQPEDSYFSDLHFTNKNPVRFDVSVPGGARLASSEEIRPLDGNSEDLLLRHGESGNPPEEKRTKAYVEFLRLKVQMGERIRINLITSSDSRSLSKMTRSELLEPVIYSYASSDALFYIGPEYGTKKGSLRSVKWGNVLSVAHAARLAKENFTKEFGAKGAQQVLEFLSMPSTLDSIEEYQKDDAIKKHRYPDGVARVTYRHHLRIKGKKPVIFFTKRYETGDGRSFHSKQIDLRHKKEFKKGSMAHTLGVGPKIAYFAESGTLIQQAAIGKSIGKMRKSRINFDVIEAIGKALGRLHQKTSHGDLDAGSAGLVADHIFISRSREGWKASFIDYGFSYKNKPSTLQNEYEGLLNALTNTYTRLDSKELERRFAGAYRQGLEALSAARLADFPIVDLVGDAPIPDASDMTFGTLIPETSFELADRAKFFNLKTDSPRILVIGGVAEEVGFLFKRYPNAIIKVVNLSQRHLLQIQHSYGQKEGETIRPDQLTLFKADAGQLNNVYFPDESFDLIFSNGVDFTAFKEGQMESLQMIALEEQRLVAPGGFIFHSSLDDDDYKKLYENGLNSGKLSLMPTPGFIKCLESAARLASGVHHQPYHVKLRRVSQNEWMIENESGVQSCVQLRSVGTGAVRKIEAHMDGRLAGHYIFSQPLNNLFHIFVMPEFRGKGVVDVLLEDLIGRQFDGNREKRFSASITRESARAMNGKFFGTTADYRQVAGLLGEVSLVKVMNGSAIASAARLAVSGGSAEMERPLEKRSRRWEPIYHWDNADMALENIRQALKLYRPQIMEAYEKFDDLKEEQREQLRRQIYEITSDHFGIWSVKRGLSDYFDENLAAALQPIFPRLKLDRLGFGLKWTTPKKGRESVCYVLTQKIPGIMDRYSRLHELSNREKEALKEEIYKIKRAHFHAWNLSSAKNKKRAPYFEGSYVVVLQNIFPDLHLDSLGFGLDWSTETAGMASLRYVLSRKAGNLVERYDRIAELSAAKVEQLKMDICKISLAHFLQWGLGGGLVKGHKSYFKGGYAAALVKFFNDPRLELSLESIKEYRIKHRTTRYSWKEGMGQGIKNIRDAVGRFDPVILEKYNKRNELSPGEIEELKSRIYKLDHTVIPALGILSVGNRKDVPYFQGSYIYAFQKSFDGLDLDPLEFHLDWSNPDRALESVRHVLRKEIPGIMRQYERLDQLQPMEIALLRDEVYQISSGYFEVWGLQRIYDDDIPYFEHSYVKALQLVFPRLELNPLAFGLQWGTVGQAKDSLRWVFLKEIPDIMRRYDHIDALNPDQIIQLKDDISQITVDCLGVWGIHAIMSERDAPYYHGDYREALVDFFSYPKLGLTKDDFKKHASAAARLAERSLDSAAKRAASLGMAKTLMVEAAAVMGNGIEKINDAPVALGARLIRPNFKIEKDQSVTLRVNNGPVVRIRHSAIAAARKRNVARAQRLSHAIGETRHTLAKSEGGKPQIVDIVAEDLFGAHPVQIGEMLKKAKTSFKRENIFIRFINPDFSLSENYSYLSDAAPAGARLSMILASKESVEKMTIPAGHGLMLIEKNDKGMIAALPAITTAADIKRHGASQNVRERMKFLTGSEADLTETAAGYLQTIPADFNDPAMKPGYLQNLYLPWKVKTLPIDLDQVLSYIQMGARMAGVAA